jgi:hypothetical protein
LTLLQFYDFWSEKDREGYLKIGTPFVIEKCVAFSGTRATEHCFAEFEYDAKGCGETNIPRLFSKSGGW